MDNKWSEGEIYDWLESFDFEELSVDQKTFVQEFLTEKTYRHMRKTVIDTRELFTRIPQEFEIKSGPAWIRMLKYPIEFYKIAAALILITTLTLGLFKDVNKTSDKMIAMTDTLIVNHYDTVWIHQKDTIFMTRTAPKSTNSTVQINRQNSSALKFNKHQPQSKRNLVDPDDMDQITRTNSGSSCNDDQSLSQFLVSVR